MSELEVRIVKLEPMRVATALGFGEQPEPSAWDKILAWAKPLRLIDDMKVVRFFGFNNPDPSPGSPNYGYEQWIVVGPDVKASGDITIKDFSGGLYAVSRCKLSNIGEAWRQLVLWRDASKYLEAHHQCLEELLNPALTITPDGKLANDETLPDKMILDLYLPIAQ